MVVMAASSTSGGGAQPEHEDKLLDEGDDEWEAARGSGLVRGRCGKATWARAGPRRAIGDGDAPGRPGRTVMTVAIELMLG